MTRKRTGNNRFLKQFNEAVILDLIRTTKPISKADLSQLTGLTPTAVGVITQSLLEQGYIHESGTGKSKGGRRPILLELKPQSFFSIGVDIDVGRINIILIDITGEILDERCISIPKNIEFEKCLHKIEDGIGQVLNKNDILTDKLLGIGISVAGLVDSKTCEIILAPNLGWQDISIKSYLTIYDSIPIYLENEAMASAIYESWIGSCQGIDDFVCINIKSGIGAGIFTNGRLYRGTGGSAGEVGHIVVDENGPKCGCGNYGCLETLASTTGIVEKVKKLLRQGIVSKLNEIENIDEIDIDIIINAAKQGDEASRNILLDSARYMGIAISNIVNTLNPCKIILGKDFVKYSNIVLEYIKSIVAAKALKFPASKVEIEASAVGEKASTLGAAIVPLKVLFGR